MPMVNNRSCEVRQAAGGAHYLRRTLVGFAALGMAGCGEAGVATEDVDSDNETDLPVQADANIGGGPQKPRTIESDHSVVHCAPGCNLTNDEKGRPNVPS